MFTLAQHDIASIFTLPTTVYGRQDVLSEITFFIERCGIAYRSLRFCNGANVTVNEIRSQTVTTTAQEETGNEIPSDLSETNSTIGTSGCDISSAASQKSHRNSGGSIVGNTSTRANSKRGNFNNLKASSCATIIGVYGPGGIGKLQ